MRSDDELVHRAMVRRRQLLEELAQVDSFLATASALMGDDPSRPSPTACGFGPDVPYMRRPVRPAELVEAAIAVLRSAGRPLNRGELFEGLVATGIWIAGSDPVKNMGTVLWRSRRFDNTGRVYWIRGELRPE